MNMEKYHDNFSRLREIVDNLDCTFRENRLPGSPLYIKCIANHYHHLKNRKDTIKKLLLYHNIPDDIIDIILQEELYYLHLSHEGYSLQENINKFQKENYEQLR